MPNLDTGNTAFMLLCTSLVMLMTPGLAFFYGGLVGRKNVLAIMIQSFVSVGWTTVLWWACGFSLCFSCNLANKSGHFGIIGNLDWAFLSNIALHTPSPSNDTIPMIVFCAYQMMFAIITPALITGAFTNRITFKAYMRGFLGIVLLGVFALTAWNPVATGGVDGLLRGNSAFYFKQLGAVATSSLWAFVFTYGMLWIIDKTTPVRVEDASEEIGLDESLHGEKAYLEGV